MSVLVGDTGTGKTTVLTAIEAAHVAKGSKRFIPLAPDHAGAGRMSQPPRTKLPPEIRANSSTLRVTITAPSAKACAAMMVSRSPIFHPVRSNCTRTLA